jgi:hypothetical protein
MSINAPIDWDLSKVIPGQVATPETVVDEDDDIAPGVLVVRPSYSPVLHRAGGAAMVVAAVTGRAIGITARAGWTGGTWFTAGFRATCVLGWRYVRGHDHQEVLGGMKSGTDWNRVGQTRKSRWRFLGWAALATPVIDMLGWWAITAWTGIPADYSWPILPGLEAAAAITAITAYGRYRLQAPDIAPQQIVADMDNPESDEPYPLAWADSPGRVQECVSRALYAENIETRQVTYLGAHAWGHELRVTLKGSTAGKVNAAADQLDAHFNIARGGTLIEPDPQQSAEITLRLVTSDPFAGMARPNVHFPGSLSVRETAIYGQGMDGSPLEFRLRGMSMLVIGSSGSAKTKGALRSLAEAITACRDAIAIEMDPVKDGLSEFSPAMAVPPIRGAKDCTEWLARMVKLASARNAVKSRLNMGDLWQPSAKHPTVFVIVDEFIYLPKEAKELAIELLRIGRETGVHIIFAAQEATEDSLGDAIASAVTYRIMLASRSEDVRLVFGKGASDMGYRPDRLRPAVDEERVYDAAKFYIQGPGFLRPIQWRWHRLERDQIREAVKERMAVGRPWFDHESLAAADLLHVIRRDSATTEASLADRLDSLDHDDAPVIAALLRAFEAHQAPFLPTTEVLLPAVDDDQMDSATLATLLRKHAPDAAAVRQPWDGKPQVRGWQVSAVEQAAAGLIDPSTARLRTV